MSGFPVLGAGRAAPRPFFFAARPEVWLRTARRALRWGEYLPDGLLAADRVGQRRRKPLSRRQRMVGSQKNRRRGFSDGPLEAPNETVNAIQRFLQKKGRHRVGDAHMSLARSPKSTPGDDSDLFLQQEALGKLG